MACECGCNKSIECTVENCKHHNGEHDYCALDKILVGNCHTGGTETDCKSFETK